MVVGISAPRRCGLIRKARYGGVLGVMVIATLDRRRKDWKDRLYSGFLCVREEA